MTRINFKALFLLLIIFAIYWKFFVPGVRVATDFPLVSEDQLKHYLDLPRVWSEAGAEGLGEHSVFFLWSWPLSFLVGLLVKTGLTFALIEKFFFLAPTLIIGVFGILKLTKILNFSSPTRLICALFYLTNTYILLLVDGGQLSIGLTYAFFPIAFLAVEKSLTARIKEKILAGLAVSILGFLDIRFVYILLILYLIRFFYQFFLDKDKRRQWLLGWLKTGLIVSAIFLGLNFYWLFPILQDPSSKNTYSLFTQFDSSNLNLGHPLLLISPHWHKNIFGAVSPLKWEFVLIPILIFLAPLLRPKNRILGFWLLLALVSCFLAKGDAQPLASIYRWLFNNIPFFSILADSTKFFVLVALSYTVLLGFTLEGIKQKIRLKRINLFIYLFTTLYLIYLAHPVWLGLMTGMFSQSPNQMEYHQMENILKQDTNFSRIFWLPIYPPLGYVSPTHPRVEAARLVQKRPFAAGTVGSYEFTNFLREAAYMGEIFDVSAIGYIAYPLLDQRRTDTHPDNLRYYDIFSRQLSQRSWLAKIEDSPISLFKVRRHQDRFFATNNIWWIVGSDDLLNEATKSAKLRLSENALIFAEEYPGLSQRLDEITEVKIVLNNKTILDLSASFIDRSDLIFPASQLDFNPNSSGWWKREASDLIRWRDFLQTKYGIDSQDFDLGGGWAVGEGNLKLRIENGKLKKDRILLARVLESTRSSQLRFYQDETLIGQVDTSSEGASNIRWFEVGQLKKDGQIIIESEGDINVVNGLASLEKSQWETVKQKADNLQKSIVEFRENNTKEVEPTVTYIKVNSTKYKVSISNLSSPSIVIFSQSYDGSWKMNKETSIPVYSLLNGFRVERDGDYIVEFEAQKYVYPGLIISGLTLLLVTAIIFKVRKS